MSKNPPLVWGYRWESNIVETARKEKKLLRATVAIPGGSHPHQCNSKCIFCFTEQGERHGIIEEITNREVVAFLKEASEFALYKDLMNYFFVSEGEPSLNKGLIEVLQEVSTLGGTMTIFTNLFFLPDSLASVYANLKNLFICGKLYGINSETNDYLTGIDGSYEMMMTNIHKLIDMGLAKEGRLGVQCVVTSRNQDEIIQIFKWGRENNVVPHIMMYREQGLGVHHPELVVPIHQLMDIFKECAEYDRNEWGYEWVPMPPMLGLGTCYIPGVNLYLVSNGEVHVCAGDRSVIGNYRKQAIAQMIDSPILFDLRKYFNECPWVTELRERGELLVE